MPNSTVIFCMATKIEESRLRKKKLLNLICWTLNLRKVYYTLFSAVCRALCTKVPPTTEAQHSVWWSTPLQCTMARGNNQSKGKKSARGKKIARNLARRYPPTPTTLWYQISGHILFTSLWYQVRRYPPCTTIKYEAISTSLKTSDIKHMNISPPATTLWYQYPPL